MKIRLVRVTPTGERVPVTEKDLGAGDGFKVKRPGTEHPHLAFRVEDDVLSVEMFTPPAANSAQIRDSVDKLAEQVRNFGRRPYSL